MSLMETLREQGVTAEDLEKAASVRLFEKVAASESVDLNSLNEAQVNELYAHFTENVLPGMGGDEAPAAAAEEAPAADAKTAAYQTAATTVLFLKQASDEKIDVAKMDQSELDGLYAHFTENVLPGMLQEDAPTGEKDAGMRPPTVYLFEKMAAAEKIDLGAMSDDDLGGLYGHFLNDVLPGMLPSEEAAAPEAAAPESKTASAEDVEEAAAKLAEADILGRQMAGSFMAELNKQASGLPPFMKKDEDKDEDKDEKDSKDKKEDKDEKCASSPLFEKLADDRAAEILQANGVDAAAAPADEPQFDDLVTARAVEKLKGLGYQFEE